MRHAMATADVGDDVFGDDPSVHRLENHVAELLGKQAAVFVSSGTQSNLCALMAHCQRGDEYLVGDHAHTYMFEGGGAAVLGSIQPQTVPMLESGMLDLAAARSSIKPDDAHFARTRLLCLENTTDGKVLGLDDLVVKLLTQDEVVAEAGVDGQGVAGALGEQDALAVSLLREEQVAGLREDREAQVRLRRLDHGLQGQTQSPGECTASRCSCDLVEDS